MDAAGRREPAGAWGANRPGLLDQAIIFGAIGFIAVLAISAYWDRSILWLHAVQALMYVATIVLVLRRSRWGYFLGFSIAAFWNYANFFVTNFFASGLKQLDILLRTGTLPKPDQFISVPAVAFHFVMVLGCLGAYAAMAGKRAGDLVRLLAAFFGSMAFFAADIAINQPRYLPLFARLLHPHLNL